MSEASTQPVGGRQIYVSMTILFFVILIANIDRFAFSVIVDPLKYSLGLSDTQVGLLAGTAFALFYATLSIPVARIADVGNRRNIISLAIGLWSVATVLCGYAQSFVQLFIFRMSVGVGEAGGAPPTHSLIASYFPPHRRAMPYAFIYIGATLGATIAFIVGAWITKHYDWQTMFIAMGAPGILVAVLARIFLVENRPSASLPSLGVMVSEGTRTGRGLFRNLAYRQLIISYTLFGFVSFGSGPWDIAFYTRTFSVPLEIAARAVGGVGLASGVLGLILGGLIGNRLARVSLRWLAYFPAICLLLSFPFYVGKYVLPDFQSSVIAMGIASTLLMAFVGPFFAALQAVVNDKERSMAAAIMIFFANIIGLGLAPLIIGFLSDQFAPSKGLQSLRYVIPIILLGLPWAAFHAQRAGRYFKV